MCVCVLMQKCWFVLGKFAALGGRLMPCLCYLNVCVCVCVFVNVCGCGREGECVTGLVALFASTYVRSNLWVAMFVTGVRSFCLFLPPIGPISLMSPRSLTNSTFLSLPLHLLLSLPPSLHLFVMCALVGHPCM